MHSGKWICRIALLIGLVAAATGFSMFDRRVEVAEYRVKTAPGGQTAVPKFHYGWLVFLHWPGSVAPHFSVLDPAADRIVAQIALEVPDAIETYSVALAVFPDRSRFAVSATSRNVTRTRSGWLMIFPADGRLLHREKITPFYAAQLAVAPDDIIWGWGYNVRTVEDRASSDPVVYRWSESGQLLKTLLPGNEFPEDAGIGGTDIRHGSAAMAVSRNRVVLYAPVSGVLAELSTSGEVLGIFKPARPLRTDGQPQKANGLAVTDDGEIYASFGRIHRFDRASGTWAPVEEPVALAAPSAIYGSAGNQILLGGASGDRFHFRLVTLK